MAQPTLYRCAPVSTDSLSAVSFTCGLPLPEKKRLKIKEINVSQVSKGASR
jgi:hypothetical protein